MQRLTTLFLLVFLLTACGGGEGTTGDNSGGGEQESSVNLLEFDGKSVKELVMAPGMKERLGGKFKPVTDVLISSSALLEKVKGDLLVTLGEAYPNGQSVHVILVIDPGTNEISAGMYDAGTASFQVIQETNGSTPPKPIKEWKALWE